MTSSIDQDQGLGASLIERLKAATGPDRELDHDIYMRADAENGSFDTLYTASLDAALLLVPAGYRFAVTDLRGGDAEEWDESASSAVVCRAIGTESRADAPTPALALCIAALRAKAVQS
jgi:hypothetical protein